MANISFYDYLATNVPSDSYAIIKVDNFRRPKSSKELSNQLKRYVDKRGKFGLLALAKIHPDKELIEAICQNCEQKQQIEEKQNLEKFSNLNENLDAQRNTNTTAQIEKSNSSKMLIVGGFILIGLALIINKK